MVKPMRNCLYLLLLLSLTVSAEVIERGALEDLMAECQSQRQQHIAPLRQQAIEDCVSKRRWERSRCENHFRTFGERHVTGTPAAMFWDLPVCQNALAAERHFRMNPRSQTYTP